MARLLYSSTAAVAPPNTTVRVLTAVPEAHPEYATHAGLRLADIESVDGRPLKGLLSTTPTGALPSFFGPDGDVATLYALLPGGTTTVTLSLAAEGSGSGSGTSGTFAAAVSPTTATLTAPGLADDPNGALLYTAVTPGTAGNLLVIQSSSVPADGTADVLNGGADDARKYIRINTTTPLTASAAMAVFNGTPAVAALVTVTLAPGSNGSALPSISDNPLTGGADTPMVRIEDGIVTAPLEVLPTQLDQPVLTLRPALGSTVGTPVLNVLHHDGTPNNASGYGVAHIDSDGGGALADGRISWAQNGGLQVDAAPGTAPLVVKVDAHVLMEVDSLGGTVLFVADPATVALQVYPYTDATVDTFVCFDPDSATKAFFIKANGEANAPRGIVLTSPDLTKYRLVVANGGALSTVPV